MPDGLPTGNIFLSLYSYPTASTMDEKEKTQHAANDGRERYMRQAIDLSIENVRKGGGPFGAVIVDNTPYLFKKYLAEAKAWTLAKPESERIVVINSWNEWGEGSYLEPDTENGMGYLEAVRDVFGSQQANGTGTAGERTVKN